MSITPESCKCTLAQKVTGDGCDKCNPSLALEYAYQTIEDQAKEIEEAQAEIKRLNKIIDDGHREG